MQFHDNEINEGEFFIKEDDTQKVNPFTFRSPYIMYSMCVLSRYMQTFWQSLNEGPKRILRYLKETNHYEGIWKQCWVFFFYGFLDNDCSRSVEEYARVLIYAWKYSFFMEFQET